MAAAVAQWITAEPALAVTGRGRRVGGEAAALFEVRLDALRHLDDTVGAGQVYDAAALELRLVTDLLKHASYSEATGRRLFAAAAEASRLAGWCAYDHGRTAAAERHFITSLRACACAEDPTLGAVTLAFWANLRYNADDPQGALHLIEGALAHRRRISSPRVMAMLHARAARAQSKAGEPTAAWHQVDAAFDAYSRADSPEADLPSMYWINHGELHQVAASSALSLGEPRRALENFDAALTHADPYDTERETRGAAIYQARKAEAHLALGDIDAALDIGHQVITAMGGIDSARATDALEELRGQFAGHQHIPAVRAFLDYAA
ncbi:transcriptional regulator [Streptomyces sp. NPDC092296]|uniref:transcriptional regulator n=1 Tax=Streptomyces sp. NPDC092296 TaxID=3366012 RepID=UPI00382AD99B